MHKGVPANNRAWWFAKLAKNVQRDRETDQYLRALGWTVLRYWEHEAADDVIHSVIEVLGGPS